MNWKIVAQTASAGMIGFSAALIGALSAKEIGAPISIDTWLIVLAAAVAAMGKDLAAQYSPTPGTPKNNG